MLRLGSPTIDGIWRIPNPVTAEFRMISEKGRVVRYEQEVYRIPKVQKHKTNY